MWEQKTYYEDNVQLCTII